MKKSHWIILGVVAVIVGYFLYKNYSGNATAAAASNNN